MKSLSFKRFLVLGVFCALVLSVVGCSSSSVKGGAGAEENLDGETQLNPADAATDAVPLDGAEDANASKVSQSEKALPSQNEEPANQEFESYTVQAGDTLMKLAFETYGDIFKWRRIFEANQDKISDPNVIPKGVVLKLEKSSSPSAAEKNGEKYLIQKGDTLGKISGTLYGTPARWKEIWENNKQLIKNPNRIFAGFTIYYIPPPGSVQNSGSQNSGEMPADSAMSGSSSELSGSPTNMENQPQGTPTLPQLNATFGVQPAPAGNEGTGGDTLPSAPSSTSDALPSLPEN